MLHHELIPAADKNSRRLMLMLHGLGDSIEGYRWWPQALGLPWLNHVLVNAPDEYYGGGSWFDFPGDSLPGVRRSTKLLFELLDDLRARGYPTEQTVLGGFSQGCLMAIEVALRYPHRLAGVVGISGRVSDPALLLRELSPVAKEQRLLVTHGPLDPVIPFAVTRQQIQQLQAAGLNIEWREFMKDHTIAGEPELAVIREFIRARFGG
ncbi:MAG: serine esterase [Verrucomicrobia bacterium]|nr:serine esterase [Verrucomicrobiota bacterium]